MSHALVVADSARTRREVGRQLATLGHEVSTARAPASALRRPQLDRIDVAILDLGELDVALAVRTLLDVIRIPLVTVSSRGPTVHIQALDAGADDHLDLPVDAGVLGARMRALERRRWAGRTAGDVVVTEDFLLDLVGRHAVRAGADVHLTPREWSLVDVLVRNEGRIVPQEGLLASVWGPTKSGQANYLRVFMHTLRQKLEPDSAHPRYFHTVPGTGIRFDSGQAVAR